MDDRVRPARLLLLALVAAAAILPGIGRTDLFNPDEPREAEMGREMYVSGDLLAPALNGALFLEKPPLYYWLMVGAFHLTGAPGELGARLVPAASAIACVLMTYLFGAAMVGEEAAALAALVLLSANKLALLARHSIIDVSLSAAVLLCCGALFHAYQAEGRGRHLAFLVLAYTGMALALLFKGVVGAALPGLAIVAFLAARRDVRGAWRLGLVPGSLLSLVPVGAWVWRLGQRHGADAVHTFVWVNNVERFTGGAEGAGHTQPVWYYLPTLLLDTLPWTVPLVLAVPWAVQVARGRTTLHERRRIGILFALAWLAAPLLVLSAGSTKRGIYLLPLYPALALLIGAFFVYAAPRRGVAVALFCSGALPLLALAGALAYLRLGSVSGWAGAAAGAALVLLAALPAVRAAHLARLARHVALAATFAYVGAAWAVLPPVVNRRVSLRPFAERLGAMAAQRPLAFYRLREGAQGQFLFYAARTFPHLREPAQLVRHLQEPGAAALVRADELARVAHDLPWPTRVEETVAPPESPLMAEDQPFVLVSRAP